MRHVAPPCHAIRRATRDDAARIEAIAGVDVSDKLNRLVVLLSANCAFFLDPLTSSIYECHFAALPEGRGAECVAGARLSLRYATDMLGALVVFGRIPVEDKPARMLTRIIGLKSDGIRPYTPDGPLVEWFEYRGAR